MNFFTQNNIPKIYAYTDEHFPGMLKVGYTTKTAAERVKEQYPVKMPHQTWEIVLEEIATRENGTYFTDHDLHKRLSPRKRRVVSLLPKRFRSHHHRRKKRHRQH